MKKCPECGKSVSCRQWMYCDKMCRKCSAKMRYRKEKNKGKKSTK